MQELLFIALNIGDAYLTKTCLSMGSVEANPLAVHFGSSLIAKGLLALGIIVCLRCFGKEKLIWWLNLVFFGVVVWNFTQYAILYICGITCSI